MNYSAWREKFGGALNYLPIVYLYTSKAAQYRRTLSRGRDKRRRRGVLIDAKKYVRSPRAG